MQLLHECEVLGNEPVAPEHFRLHLAAPDMAMASRPGQFCMIEINPGWYPFLRRPMSFEQILDDSITILYKIEGEGTQLLSQCAAGQTISVQGPLGNGFSLDPAYQRHIIVAGGIGVAPFPALAKSLTDVCSDPPEVIVAARTKDFVLCTEYFEELGCEVHVATDDGTLGHKAFACDVLRCHAPGSASRVYVCGPMVMMKTTSEVALAAGSSCLVSLEAQMACGDGACLGCVVEAKTETEGEMMVRVCKEGPVFDTAIIDWEAHNLAYDR